MKHPRPASAVACVVLAASFLLSAVGGAAWGQQGTTAVVTGTERVFVRRGPGAAFPPFATLTRGTTVEVQEMQGEWSRVTTASGQVGYIHSNFLGLPTEHGPGAAAEAPQPEPTARAPARPEAAPPSALSERNKLLEAQVSALQEELAMLRGRAAAPAPTAAAATGDAEDVRAELKRLTAAVEGLQHRVNAGAPPADAAPPATSPVAETTEHLVSPTALLLGGIGLLAGWLVGTAYGRNQERGRRSRIRF